MRRYVAVAAGELHADVECRVLDLVVVVVSAQFLVLVDHMVDAVRIDPAGEAARLANAPDPGLLKGEPADGIALHVEEQGAEIVVVLGIDDGDVESQIVADLRDDDPDIPMPMRMGTALVLIPSGQERL